MFNFHIIYQKKVFFIDDLKIKFNIFDINTNLKLEKI